MGARWLIAMLLMSGCDYVYDLRGRTEPVIDAPVVDAADLDAPEVDAPACPNDYVPLLNTPATSRYRIVTASNPRWPFAMDDCRNDTPATGITHLIVFDDTTELVAIQAALPSSPLTYAAWVGYARNVTDPPLMFRSVTDVPIATDSNLWNPGEPDNGNGIGPAETIVRIARNNNGLVDSKQLDIVNGYVCECDFVSTIGIEFDVE